MRFLHGWVSEVDRPRLQFLCSRMTRDDFDTVVSIDQTRDLSFLGITIVIIGYHNNLAKNILKNCLSVLIVTPPFH
jgi:hypothetical protein